MIHFVTIHLHEQVHAQALGFTKTLYMYGWGKDPAEAGRNVMAYCQASDLKPDRISSAILSHEQDLGRFTFPEQIYGLPAAVGRLTLSRRSYTEAMIEESLQKFSRNQSAVQKGLKMLAASDCRGDAQRLEDARRAAADQAYVDYDFGDLVQVDSANGWTRTTAQVVQAGPSEWSRAVFISPRGDDAGGETERVTFTVRFRPGATDVDEVYAIDPKGQVIGAPAREQIEVGMAPAV